MNDAIYKAIARAAYEGACLSAPHVYDLEPVYPFEASDRIMKIIRAEQLRLGV